MAVVRAYFRRLSPRQRRVLRLSVCFEVQSKDIARRVGRDPKLTREDLCRGKKGLREHLVATGVMS